MVIDLCDLCDCVNKVLQIFLRPLCEVGEQANVEHKFCLGLKAKHLDDFLPDLRLLEVLGPEQVLVQTELKEDFVLIPESKLEKLFFCISKEIFCEITCDDVLSIY